MQGSLFSTVERSLEAIGPASDALRKVLTDILDQEGLACVELAFVEALTNSIAFADQADCKPIRVFLDVSPSEVAIEIEDGLPPRPDLFAEAGAHRLDFDPSDRQAIPESGRGLSLIVVSMDRVEYRAVAGTSRLRLVRRRA